MFTQQNIKTTILNLEKKYPVDTWVVNGIHIWPYVRIKLYIHMLVLMNDKPLSVDKSYEKIKKDNTTISFLKKSIFLFKSQLSLVFFFFKLKQKKLIFFGSHIHRVFLNGQHFNRFYDSMIDFHNLQNEVYTIEYQKINEPLYNRKSIIPLHTYLDYYKFISKVFKKIKKTKNEANLREYDDFLVDLKLNGLELETLNLSDDKLIKWSNKVNISAGFFKKLFKNVNPQKVVFLGYYGLDDLYAALITANNLKIKTIDFQHGPQTNVHLAFSSWYKVPQKGFNTMPVEFWNWDEASKSNIDSWVKKTEVINAKIVGQPYLAYWISKKQKIDSKRSYVFYSLQTYPFTIKDMLTPKIVALIKALDYKWILRLHPRNNLDIDMLKLFLEKNQINNKTIIQDAFNTPLPEVLTSSLIHVTNYSGCLIEAYQLGIPTLLINEVGYEMFSEYIDDKLVYYLSQNNQNFQLEAVKLISDLKSIDFKSNYSQVFNPLNQY